MNSLRTVLVIFLFALVLGGCYACPGYYCPEGQVGGNSVIQPASPNSCPGYAAEPGSLPYNIRYQDITPVYRSCYSGYGTCRPYYRPYHPYRCGWYGR